MTLLRWMKDGRGVGHSHQSSRIYFDSHLEICRTWEYGIGEYLENVPTVGRAWCVLVDFMISSIYTLILLLL